MRVRETAALPHWTFFVLIGTFGAVYSYRLGVGGEGTGYLPDPAYSAFAFVVVWVLLWMLGALLVRSRTTDSLE